MKEYPGKSIRIFKNPILESFTHVNPIVPLIIWVPVIIYLLRGAIFFDQISHKSLLLFSLLGFLTWTLMEYLLHRLIFHWDAKSSIGKRFVYIFHGLHHDDPKDPTRLVMPPVPGLLIYLTFRALFSLLIPSHYLNIFMAFFLIGYLCYDYIHYATHHFPMRSRVGKYLKTYHIKHHYSKEGENFGVSNPIWDYFFKTLRW